MLNAPPLPAWIVMQACHARTGPLPGFTLLELLVTLSVVAVLVAIGLPSFRGLHDRLRADAARMQLVATFATARSTAVTRNLPVSICASQNGRRCEGEWTQGWMIYLDPRKQSHPASAGSVLRLDRPTGSVTTMTVTTTTGRPRLRYTPDGRSIGTNLTVTICVRGRLRGTVVVSNHGRARSEVHPGTKTCD